MAELPEAATKLRLVLDYLPCDACLAHPVADQELLCTVCARLTRQVAVRVGTRTSVLVERPSPPEAPVVIAPAAPPQPEPAPARDVTVRFSSEPSAERPGSIEVVVEPLAPEEPAPLVAPIPPPVEMPEVRPPEPVVEAEPEPEDTFDISDIVAYVPARDEFFDYKPGAARAPAARPEPEPVREPAPEVAPEPAPKPEDDDFVFRPPTESDAPSPPPEPLIEEEIIPTEEVPLESEQIETWAPPPEFLADEVPPVEEEPIAPEPIEEEIFESQLVEEEPILEMETVEETAPPAAPEPEEEILEMEVVADEPVPPAEEEIVEMQAIPDEEPPQMATGTGDLYRLRGFDAQAELGLAKVGITAVAHLSGHDAQELADRTGVAFDRLLPWIHVADLTHEVGVPLDAASALVAAGIAGPRALRDADPDETADKASAFGGATVSAREVRRWKRRA